MTGLEQPLGMESLYLPVVTGNLLENVSAMMYARHPYVFVQNKFE